MGLLDGKICLITGASRGIGFCIAEYLRKKGYNVFAPSHQELDLNDDKSVSNFLQKNNDIYFEVLINNAGLNEIADIEFIEDEKLSTMMNVNLISPLKLIRGIIPNMKKHNYGRIVNIGSIWGGVSKPGRSVYSMTKRGIHGLTQTASVELAKYNILVNTVCPGFTLTELTRKNNDVEQMKEICKKIPIGRMAEPEEQAKVVCYLASAENTYITGQQIFVDGGYTAL